MGVGQGLALIVFLAWLFALPLPFGSIIERARVPLVAVPLGLAALASLLRLFAMRDRTNTAQPTPAALTWTYGGLAFLLVGAWQLVPLPPSMLRLLSPESYELWSTASHVAALAGVKTSAFHPISIDPAATGFELFRVTALLATFIAATLLIRTHTQRIALACVLSLAAIFEMIYGVREAALQRYAIWGWVNRLIFHRVTGTFVNPNHFAHYIAIVLPMALFIGAVAWHRAGSRHASWRHRIMNLIEHRLLQASFAILATVASVAAVLLAQSRGALLALAAGALIVAALLPGRRVTRLALAATAGAVLVFALVFFLGRERTVARFIPNEFERQTLVGRRVGIATAASLWRGFPVFGSGLGTFERVVFMEQREDLGKTYHHAHNDYMEIGATAGTIGFAIAVCSLFAGYVMLVRMTFGRQVVELSWSRRAFQVAALASLTIAMVHALYDFNFFIPSNPATLAAICGAAVAVVDRDIRTRR